MKKEKEVLKKLLGGFKIGDRVKIIGCSTYATPETKKYIGMRGIITGILSSPENEKFYIVELEDTGLYICEYLAKEEDLEYDIEDEGNGN